EAVGKGGIVRDEGVRERAVETVRNWLEQQPGWVIEGVIPSPIEGGGGNVEFLLGAKLIV
ncbi:MAG: TlyA family rRNA (cytidine-2'-O)-methyltransferase, partial [Hyphomicrobiales bacterium]|nr:TlyA family rRNA (cytidine-2'-O)-methyltransferase [Hyphomicrobiales bacterium]